MDGEVFAVFAWIVGIGLSVFWMVIGWRAMRAHERIAGALDKFEQITRPRPGGESR